MILAVVVLLIVCIRGLMMLERNGAFLSKIHLTDTVFSSEASDLGAVCSLVCKCLEHGKPLKFREEKEALFS